MKSINPANVATELTLDRAGNVLRQTVAGRVTAFAYDRRNLQLSETLNPGDANFQRITRSEYDARGNRSKRIFPDGTVTDYAYNPLGWVASVNHIGAQSEDRYYLYNAAGAAVEVTENNRKSLYTYDKLGRVTRERKQLYANATWTTTSDIASTYDVTGNRLTVSYPNQRTLISEYDRRNLLTKVTDGTLVTTYRYDDAGNRIGMTMPNIIMAPFFAIRSIV